ncbi:zinc-binding alcohol dehydrogenase family protein [Curtobacterium sp. RRHDQ10]|uniref:zinc-binding alcohol dehydrogenase family protein n=1 Tax=Curtobacterium phyllosphaerae TaxID=3413379 RepID=UPI003BF16E02
MTAPQNAAAWLDGPRADLTVRSAPYTHPGPGEIVVRNRAVAVNPLDTVKQWTGDLMYRWLPYPSVLGEDVAGEVVEVGEGVTRVRPGDRVIGYAVGMEKGRRHHAEGGFQRYTVLRAHLVAPIPDDMPYERAVVLPLAVSTAASALFQQDQLGLAHPTRSAPPVRSDVRDTAVPHTADRGSAVRGAAGTAGREAVVVWGASTSVGSSAIQLASAAGYTVVTTASPQNHERALALGATAVVDYRSPSVVAEVVRALRGCRVVGVLAVGIGSAEPAIAIASSTHAPRVTLASPSVSFEALPRDGGMSLPFIRTVATLVGRNLAVQVRARSRRIRVRFVWGSTLMGNEVGPMLWERFLPRALADGSFVPSPEPLVVGRGLETVQVGFEALRRGVSAQKVVVLLDD